MTDPGESAAQAAVGIRRGSLLISVDDAAKLLGIGRTHCFRLVLDGQILSVRLGRRRLVVRAALDDFITSLCDRDECESRP